MNPRTRTSVRARALLRARRERLSRIHDGLMIWIWLVLYGMPIGVLEVTKR